MKSISLSIMSGSRSLLLLLQSITKTGKKKTKKKYHNYNILIQSLSYASTSFIIFIFVECLYLDA